MTIPDVYPTAEACHELSESTRHRYLVRTSADPWQSHLKQFSAQQTPTATPSTRPTAPTFWPSVSPSTSPTGLPSEAPTDLPTRPPSESPTTSPTQVPTQAPTEALYPNLLSLSIARTGPSIIVSRVAVSRPGTVYVWATIDASSTPGGAAIKGAPCGSVAVSAAGVGATVNVTCSSLTPLTAYSLFYYTEGTSVPSYKLPDWAVQASMRTVGTSRLMSHHKL
jgi:hypothetical protein